MNHVLTIGLIGGVSRPVRVTAYVVDPHDVTHGVSVPHGLSVHGLGEAAGREASVRVRSAIANAGIKDLPPVMVQIPDVLLPGTGTAKTCSLGAWDLAIALAVLGAAGKLDAYQEELAHSVVIGELSLSGNLRGVRGMLPMLLGASKFPGIVRAIVPRACEGEATIAATYDPNALQVCLASSLSDVLLSIIRGEAPDARTCVVPSDRRPASPAAPDFAGLRVPDDAIEAFCAAVLSGKNVLLVAPPSASKLALARRAAALMGPLSIPEALDVASIHSEAGLEVWHRLTERPFRAPHHTCSAAGLVGGGHPPRAGEATLAHHGVLVLDDCTEFRRTTLDALASVLRSAETTVHGATFPAAPRVVLTATPCACGYSFARTAASNNCKCSPDRRARWETRLGELATQFCAVRINFDPWEATPSQKADSL